MLIEKGGNQTLSLSGKPSIFYDTAKKEKMMQTLDKCVPKMDKTTERVGFQSIYKKSSVPDHYDSLKVAKIQENLSHKKKVSSVSMEKQTRRKFETLLGGNDAYKNVMHDNARAEYIKRLLEN